MKACHVRGGRRCTRRSLAPWNPGAANGASEPAVIAHHYSRAGKFEKASQFLAACRRPVRRTFGIHRIDRRDSISRSSKRNRSRIRRYARAWKLEAQLKLGRSLVFQKGPQSTEAELAFTEAHRLAKEANAGPQLFQSAWGLYVNAARNRQYDKAKLRGDELLTISEELGDEDLKFEALHHRWGFAYFTGQTADMLASPPRG